jgi:hypothetical protein
MVLNGARSRCLWLFAMAACLTTAAGCTSGVVPGRAYEDPLDLPGRLLGSLPKGARPLASVIWTDPLERRPDVAMPARWIDSTVAEATAAAGASTNTIASFTLRLFRAPPAEALAEIPSPSGDVALMAFGELVIVDDGDGDGTFQIDGHGTLGGGGRGAAEATPDRYLAGSQEMLVYVVRPFPPAAGANFHLVQGAKTGYQLMKYVCEGRVLSRVVPAVHADLEPQTSGELVRRRTCMNTHSP